MTRIRPFEIQNQNVFLRRGHNPPQKNFWAALDLAHPRLQVLDAPLSRDSNIS